MEQYIPKSALVSEIENRIKKYILLQQKPEMSDLQEELQNKIDCLNSIKGYIINTLEVKDVDLEKEIDNYIYSHLGRPRMALELDWKYCDIKFKPEKLTNFARHFFELGLQAQKGE